MTHFESISFNKYYDSWRCLNKVFKSSQVEKIGNQKNTAIAKQTSHLRESFKDLLAALRSQATSSTPSIDCCHYLRNGLEIWLESISAFTSFVSNPNTTATEPLETGFALWRRYYRRTGIKDSTSAIRNLSGYT